jgi:hypothetical protein
MPLPCPKCGQYEVAELQAACPGGCDLTEHWSSADSAIPEAENEVPISETEPAAGMDEAATPAEQVVPNEEQLAAAEPNEPEPAEEGAGPEAAPALTVEAETPTAVPVAELLCPGCQATVQPTMRFCDSCGWPLTPHCPECGADNRQGARFCQSCGARLATKLEQRGRTRYCPTCGHSLAGLATGRRTDAVLASPGQPQLCELQTPVPVAAPDPAAVAATDEVPVARAAGPEEPVAEGAPSREFELVVVKADGTVVAAFPLNAGDNLVGVRTAGAAHAPVVDLAPFDNRKVISRRHALLRVAADRLLLADCGSTNGTTVNNQALSKMLVEVTEKSEIAFAGLRCRIRAK